MQRYISKAVKEYLGRKIAVISGPRQVGKTTLAKSLSEDSAYYNYDIKKDIDVFLKQEWDRSKKHIIFDEIHKMKNWKLWLKGLYDEGILKKQAIIVTGSARLDVAKKMGDSLAGRFFHYRLYPLDLWELSRHENDLEECYRKILSFSGFPEPYLEGSDKFYGLWKKTHSDLILRQDMLSLESIRDIDGVELLVELLSRQVGSLVSYNSLARDIGRDDKTVKRWIDLLEDLYIVFRVHPYSRNVAHGLKKMSKVYFYDVARAQGGESTQLENLVALSLKKQMDFKSDTEGKDHSLHFIRDKNGREIDFLVKSKKAQSLIEVKLNDSSPSNNFYFFEKSFKGAQKIQVVRYLDRKKMTKNNVVICPAIEYLSQLDEYFE